MGLLLVTCGVVLAGTGTWSGYRNAREARVPHADHGHPTRAAIDAARPPHARAGMRRFARSAAAAIGWLAVAPSGMFPVQAGSMLVGAA